MSVVFTPDPSGSGASPIALAGGVWMLFGTLTFSGSYAANGDPLDLRKRLPQMSGIRRVVTLGAIRGLTAEYDAVNSKLKLFVNTAPTGSVEHTAAAIDATLTASPVPVAFLVK